MAKYYDPKRTKEIQDAAKDQGKASTYYGLIVLGIVVIGVIAYFILH